jgi:hypothetical protein
MTECDLLRVNARRCLLICFGSGYLRFEPTDFRKSCLCQTTR